MKKNLSILKKIKNYLKKDDIYRFQALQTSIDELNRKISLLEEDNNRILSNLSNSTNVINDRISSSAMGIENRVLPVIQGISSFCMNEYLIRQGTEKDNIIFDYYNQLHNILRCYRPIGAKYTRIGRHHDGGYVMLQPLSENKIAYSFGICDDVSWDLDIANEGYEIYQYDHTICELPENNQSFHWQKLGLTGGKETDELKNIETILINNNHIDCEGMLLKVDIEGCEWDFINSCDSGILAKFDQIVMEMHSLSDFYDRERKLSALRKLAKTHALVSVHGNNYRRVVYSGNCVTPDVIEVTLVNRLKYELKEDEGIIFPSALDENNFTEEQDIIIGKW